MDEHQRVRHTMPTAGPMPLEWQPSTVPSRCGCGTRDGDTFAWVARSRQSYKGGTMWWCIQPLINKAGNCEFELCLSIASGKLPEPMLYFRTLENAMSTAEHLEHADD